MSKQIDISELLSDKKKLKKISFEKLSEMEREYPFCSPLSVLVNRKQLKNNGNMSLLQMVNLVSKTDNPGLAFTSVLEIIESDKSKDNSVKKAKKKHADSTKKKKKKSEIDKQTKSVDINLSEGIVSEKLAEIYLKQGMKKEAIKMYKALSLQNPKKSTYFAKILKKIKKQ